ncbi:hypothetical protein [Aliivibrio fischeri]|uniref:hypothetical protein n=1 Tax=Aliivibrio fischeri TaxID=668 RepID=UPI001F46EC13|nr:hypothetical protein [Aliivibrio fischeri]
MKNKDLNLLRLLVILNEEKQTILAAKRMNLSQPTIKCENILATLPPLLTQLDKLYPDNTQWDISQLNGDLNILISSPLIPILGSQLIKKLTLRLLN